MEEQVSYSTRRVLKCMGFDRGSYKLDIGDNYVGVHLIGRAISFNLYSMIVDVLGSILEDYEMEVEVYNGA